MDSDDDENMLSPIPRSEMINIKMFNDLEEISPAPGDNQFRKQVSKSKLNSPLNKGKMMPESTKKYSASAKKKIDNKFPNKGAT